MQILSQDVLMSTKEEDWGNAFRDSVVLRDRLMTDAALGGPRPIKSEHSYSLLAHSPPPSPATPGVNPHTPNSCSGAVDSSTSNTSSSIDFANLDQKSLDIRRIDGKTIYTAQHDPSSASCRILSRIRSLPLNVIPENYEKGSIENILSQIWKMNVFRPFR